MGVSYGVFTGNVSVNASASKGKGSSNAQDTSFTNTNISAGNTATIKSGGDTNLKGATVQANQIKADIGGSLSIESLQDKSSYTSNQKSMGASISIPITGSGSAGGSVSASKSNIDSNFQSVGQQSGLKAGDGGFQVSVNNDTALKGGVIASTQQAINDNKNTFTTGGSLSITDIQNTASFSGKAVGASVGVGTQPAGGMGLSGVGVGLGSTVGNASSTTSAGISGIAGNTAVRTGDAETGLKPVFDADKVQKDINAQVAITQAFSREAPKAVATFSDNQARDLRTAGKDDEAKKWDEGGRYRVVLHTLAGAFGGGASGAAGAAASASTAPLMNQLQEGITVALKDAGLGTDVAKGIASGISGLTAAGVGAAVGGVQGAATAATVDFNNRQLHPSERQRAAVLAANSKGRFTKEQIEEQMRLMGNVALGVKADTITVLQGQSIPDSRNGVQDPVPMNVYGNVAIEIPGQANAEIQQFIITSTKDGAGYIPGTSPYQPSTMASNAPIITNSPPTSQNQTAKCANSDLACRSGVGVQQSVPITPAQQQAAGEYFGNMSTQYQRMAALATATGNAPVVLSFEIAAGVTGLLEQAFKPSAGKVMVDTLIDEAAKEFAKRSGVPFPIVFEVVEREIKPKLEATRQRLDFKLGDRR